MNIIQEKKIRKKLEEIFDNGESQGKKYAYQRILTLIDNGTIKSLDSVRIACLTGMDIEKFKKSFDEK